ncbi:hypothetical protein SUDANB99_05518 [Streptomyces sp. enrichment culture]
MCSCPGRFRSDHGGWGRMAVNEPGVEQKPPGPVRAFANQLWHACTHRVVLAPVDGMDGMHGHPAEALS